MLCYQHLYKLSSGHLNRSEQLLIVVSEDSSIANIKDQLVAAIEGHIPDSNQHGKENRVRYIRVGDMKAREEIDKMDVTIDQIATWLYQLGADFNWRGKPRTEVPNFWGFGNGITIVYE